MMRFVLYLCASLFLAGCASHSGDDLQPKTVGSVNLKRYQGTWYELARLPMFFQRHCAQSEATYGLQEDGSLAVSNRCRTTTGEWQQAQGQAVPQLAGQSNKLWVRFDNWASRLLPGLTKGEYWVLYLDDDYQNALVGHPNRKYLWLLSRSPNVSAQTRELLLGEAQSRGYDTDRLIWRSSNQQIER